MEGKGVGRIAEANLGPRELQGRLRAHQGHDGRLQGRGQAAAAAAPEHVLRRKLEDRAALSALKPPQLLQATLQSYDRPLTAGEIREILNGIVSESQWTSWWSAARKHGHVVATGTGSRQTYRWADEQLGRGRYALEGVREGRSAQEDRAPEARRRPRSRPARRSWRRTWRRSPTASCDQDPGLAFEIWFALERTGGAPEDVDWSPEELLLQRDPTRLFAGIEDRLLRERAYTMVRERREDWPDVYRGAMTKETDPRALDLLADGLRDRARQRSRSWSASTTRCSPSRTAIPRPSPGWPSAPRSTRRCAPATRCACCSRSSARRRGTSSRPTASACWRWPSPAARCPGS